MKHGLSTPGATHPCSIMAAFISNLLPQLHGHKIAIVLLIIASDLRIRIGIWAIRTTHVTGVNDGNNYHQGKLFSPCPETIGLLSFRL
jgi:hypothetical protein